MIYLVSANQDLFKSDKYKQITVKESWDIMKDWKVIQVDSETSGTNPHLCKLLCFQFGHKDTQIVVDCTTIDIKLYKNILEDNLLIGQNLKFDLQFLYNYNIIPRKVYDTMIVEQLLHLGYPPGTISYSLKEIAWRRLGINIDKSVRGEIIWRGLDERVILYASSDVRWLEDIMKSQIEECKSKQCLKGAKLECDVVPAMAYLEWCGIKLDEDKWKEKMKQDLLNLGGAQRALDDFIINHSTLSKKYTYVNRQGDIFSGFDLTPKCTINWSSSRQVVEIAKALGFNTVVQDKKTGEDKDSVLEKHLSTQKGINDVFLKLYFEYQEYAKVVSSFGQGHLDAINPVTGRIHTIYKQLGASSSRMSCGSNQPNTELEKYKRLPKGSCKYPNLQQLPHDALTRSCFVAPEGHLFCSCDYSSQEGRTQAEIYNEPVLINMYKEGLDSHSVNAKIFFKEELEGIDVKDVKKLKPELRQAAKAPFFALSYGGGYTTLMSSLGIDEDRAKSIVKNYEEGYKATMEFAKKGEAFVKANGYIVINPTFGHKLWWWDHDVWLKRQQQFTPEFWDMYRSIKEEYNNNPTIEKPQILIDVSTHFKAASKYSRLARNAPSQGSSAIMTKLALVDLFNWIVDSNNFNIVHIVNVTHDEINTTFPASYKDFYPNLVQDIMAKAGSVICTKVDVPAEAAVGDHWIH